MESGTYEFQDGGATMAGFGLVFWLVILACYLFFAWAHFRVAQKAGCNSTAWWAFIPILNMVLMCQTARKPGWWFLFFLVPIANIFVMAYLWAETCKYIGQSPVWGWLMLLPIVNFVSLLVMAFSGGTPSQPIPPKQPKPRQPVGVA